MTSDQKHEPDYDPCWVTMYDEHGEKDEDTWEQNFRTWKLGDPVFPGMQSFHSLVEGVMHETILQSTPLAYAMNKVCFSGFGQPNVAG
jgi:hypothetical protein